MRLLRGQADHCRHQAWLCRRDAKRITDPIFHGHLIRMAQRWEMLAEKFELAEDVSGLLQWNAQRLEAPQ